MSDAIISNPATHFNVIRLTNLVQSAEIDKYDLKDLIHGICGKIEPSSLSIDLDLATGCV